MDLKSLESKEALHPADTACLIREQKRVRELLSEYQEHSPGTLAVGIMEHVLTQADQAISSGAIAKIAGAYVDLKRCQ